MKEDHKAHETKSNIPLSCERCGDTMYFDDYNMIWVCERCGI